MSKTRMLRELTSRMPQYIKLTAENPLDATTPVGTLLKVTGWGRGCRGFQYAGLRGWDKVGASDPYYVATEHGTGSQVRAVVGQHVVSTRQPLQKLFSHEQIAGLVELYWRENEDYDQEEE